MEVVSLAGPSICSAASVMTDLQNIQTPPYTSSPPTPEYSFHPLPDEHSLALSHNAPHHRLLESSVHVATDKRSGFTLELSHQGQNPTPPAYGRHAIVRGRILPATPLSKTNETLRRIDIELVAQLKLSIAEGGKKTETLFKLVHTLWEKDTIGTQPCPSSIPFSIPLPSEYQENGHLRPLPPSFGVAYPGVPGLFAKVVFKVNLHVEQSRKALWSKKSTLSVPFKYYPRTRAPRPIISYSLPFLSLLKIVPEDFLQIEEAIPTRGNSGVDPLHCHFFIPSSCIYALSDEIPFHIQLTGSAASIAALTKPSYGNNNLNTSSVPVNGTPLSIRVFLFRQVTVEMRGQKAWRTCVLGEGKLAPSVPTIPAETSSNAQSQSIHSTPLGSTTLLANPDYETQSSPPTPPFVSRQLPLVPHTLYDLPSPRYSPTSDGSVHESLDWDGVVKVTETGSENAEGEAGRRAQAQGADVGGFTVGKLTVKDFIVLSITPPDPPRNAFLSHQIAKPIRLVTDPMEESWDG